MDVGNAEFGGVEALTISTMFGAQRADLPQWRD